MELNLGFVDKNNQLTIATLHNNKVETTTSIQINVDEETCEESSVQTKDLFGVVYEGDEPAYDFGEPVFISSKENLPLSHDMNYEDIITKIKEHSNHQSLRHITKSIENIFNLSDQLQKLYGQSRNEFFRELWLLIRRSFLTQHLSIFYYNIDNKNDGKLSLQKISGTNKFLFEQTVDDELTMFNAIKPHISPFPTVLSYDFKKGELTLCAQINGTSFLILAKVFQFTLLQRTMFISLINGINHHLGKKVSKRSSS